jgi:transcriptional regulator with XRE-family HTH domain
LGTIVSKVRAARLTYSVKVGRPVSVSEVAKAIGVTRVYLSRIEHGKAWPNEQVVAGLCKLYGIQPGELISYEDRAARRLAHA